MLQNLRKKNSNAHNLKKIMLIQISILFKSKKNKSIAISNKPEVTNKKENKILDSKIHIKEKQITKNGKLFPSTLNWPETLLFQK